MRALVVVCALAGTAHAEWFASAGLGANTFHGFGELQVGHRLCTVPFELYLDYSYDAAISQFTFQTLGIGARTYFYRAATVQVFHQALAGAALSSGGEGAVQHRTFGDRLLGGIFEQGAGVEVALTRSWAVKAVVSTGYPVWLRSELGVTFRW